MRRFVVMLLCSLLVVVILPINTFALHYIYEDWDYEFDDANYWVNGWCYRPLDEVEKTAILVAYEPNIIKGEELIIPEIINGYRVNGFAHGLFRWSTFKKCDLSAFPNLSKRMFEESSLENVILSKDTKKIPDGCFLDCPIEEIELPEGIETIEAYAFRDTKLKELVIPSTVKELEFQVVNYCTELKKIEFKNGALTGFAEDSLSLGSTFMVENLETLILPENITYIGENEFKVAEVGRHGFNFVKYPDDLTVYGKQGSYAEAYATEHKLKFVAVESENNLPTVDITEYTESEFYHVEKIIPTEYGTILYFWPVGVPHGGKSPCLILIKEDGSKISLTEPVSRESLWNHPEHENIVLAEDGKTLTFSVSFDDRSAGTIREGEILVLHDAGTYYYKADLEAGTCIETKFEPLDTISEDVISTWAKPEVESAIELGFVPLSFRENYKRNITRAEFAKLAMYFLSVQYGYKGMPEELFWSPIAYSDNSFFSPEFMNAYAHSKTDRNGMAFRDKYDEEDYVYHNTNNEIRLPDLSFKDVEECTDSAFIKRAYHIGIVNGINETEFNPEGNITRQEAAAMLMRVYQNYAEFEGLANKFQFSDDGEIADWAKEDVHNINALGIMQGVGENVFAPLEGYTVEQAIVTFWRLYNSAPVSRKNKNITPLLEHGFELENYFDRAGGSYFHEEKRTEYENFIVVCGAWSQRHTTDLDYNLYVFDKNGGVPYTSSLTEEMKWEVSADEKILTVYYTAENTFRRFNKLNGTEKVYDKGMYKEVYDIENRKTIDFERVK